MTEEHNTDLPKPGGPVHQRIPLAEMSSTNDRYAGSSKNHSQDCSICFSLKNSRSSDSASIGPRNCWRPSVSSKSSGNVDWLNDGSLIWNSLTKCFSMFRTLI